MNKVVIAIAVATLLIGGAYLYTAHHSQDLSNHELLWKQFKTKHNKQYTESEEQYRVSVFKQNLDRIKQYQDRDQGAQYGVTIFADLTQEEFRTQKLGLLPKNRTVRLSDEERTVYKPKNTTIPEEFDWRNHSVVSDVKNQQQCGSCWAFSTIQNIESAYAIKTGKLLVLSEQELVDCDKVDLGCDGGDMQEAMTWLQNNGGVALESDYPYTAQDGKCSFDKSKAVVQVTGYVNVSTDETVIAQSLVELGPLSIGVDANPWQFYLGGISNPYFCGGELDHGVLLVGYGSGKRYFTETPYWIIKNSWGTGWGESGYIRLARGSGVCGVNQDVSSATV